jgi:hypothetical protein
MASGYWAASPKAMATSPDATKKIQTILSGLFDLILIMYDFAKKVVLFVYEMILNKLAKD